ncbi:MAG: tetratricopeptide repeat protein, partial [Bacteroidia bacterium]
MAQTSKTDSLKKDIAQTTSDSLKVTKMVALFDLYQKDYKLEDCKQIADSAIVTANRSKIKTKIGLANLLKGINYKDLEDYPNAQIYLLEALKNIDSELNKKALSDANSYMGFIQEQMVEYGKAIVYHRTALKLRTQLNEKLTSNSLLRLASCFTNLKMYDSAYFYFYKGIGIAQKYNLKRNLSGFYNNIGIAYNNEKKHDSALVYYQKALNIVTDFKDSVGMAGSLINIGSVYIELKNTDKAIEYYKRGLWIAKKTGYKQWIAN